MSNTSGQPNYYQQAPQSKRDAWPIAIIAGIVVIIVAIAVVVVMVVLQSAAPSTPIEHPASAPESSTSKPALGVNPVLQWSRDLTDDGFDHSWAVAVTADGGIVVVGHDGSPYAMAAMYNGMGDTQWTVVLKDYPGSQFRSVAIGPDGSIYAVGESAVPGKLYLAAKFSPTGDIVWARTYGGSYLAFFFDVAAFGDGIIVAGGTDSTDGDMPATHGGTDALLANIGPDGDIVWAKTFGGGADENFYSVAIGLDGTIVASGFSRSHDGDFADGRGDSDALVAGFTPAGDLAWYKSFGGSDMDLFNVISIAPDGSYFMAGCTSSMDGDLPHPAKDPGLVGIYGTCATDMTGCQWYKGTDSDYYGGIVTSGGMAVAVGGEWNVGALNLNDGTSRSGQAIPIKYPNGDYNDAAGMLDNEVVAVGITGGFSPIMVAIGFE